MHDVLVLNGQKLSLNEIIKVARFKQKIKIGEQSLEKINQSAKYVEKLIKDSRVVYGITTGFGMFADQNISQNDTNLLQNNLIISHACGSGEPLSQQTVRAMMILRINSLLKGNSGIRLTTINLLLEMLNLDMIPYVYSQGSLGASGDLVPLAHMSLPLIGRGKVYFQNQLMDSKDAFKLVGLTPITLVAKEGLALINGTQAMLAIGALTLYDAFNLKRWADLSLGFSLQALRGIKDAFDPKLNKVRPYKGPLVTINNIFDLIDGSTYITRQGEIRVQDAYSLRCASQVHGASYDAFLHILNTVEIEINAVTDNPLIFIEEDEVISGGNFHGQPLALVFDYLAIALSEIANISERRIERLINPALSNGLPAFLVKNGGLNSGFMIVQYAAAALVSENKILSHPASVDSIPSSASQEDHVSMGTIAAVKASKIARHVKRVLSIEMLCALQAIDLRSGFKLNEKSQKIYDLYRKNVKFLENDDLLVDYIEKSEEVLDLINELLNEKGWLNNGDYSYTKNNT